MHDFLDGFREVRDVPDDEASEAEKLRDEFRCASASLTHSSLSSRKSNPLDLDQSALLADFLLAIESHDEVALATAIDQAHELGCEFRFPTELRMAEDELIKLT